MQARVKSKGDALGTVVLSALCVSALLGGVPAQRALAGTADEHMQHMAADQEHMKGAGGTG